MSSPVRITEAVSIAINGLILIIVATRGKVKKHSYYNVKELSKMLDISRHHTAKVMQRLSKEGFVTSMRGPTGGFKFIKDPSTVSILDIYEAIEGPTSVKFTSNRPGQAVPLLHILEGEMIAVFKKKLSNRYISEFI